MVYLQHSRLKDEEAIDLPPISLDKEARNRLEQFEHDLALKLAAMTDKQLRASLKKAGCKFENDILVEHQSPAGPYWYHPDHPLCQDGQVLWEFPEEE